ncbi:MAG TPA: hypothetical protein VGL72_21795 [Bryobacteraceae bacterium]|jgi:hypothetical protein
MRVRSPHYPEVLAYCCLAALIALYIVGAVSNGSLRHEVQTLPLWFPIVLGFRRHHLAKWSALPCLIIWLALMMTIWSFLAGWTHLLSGHFSAIEIAMTIIVAGASAVGIVLCGRWRTATSTVAASLVFLSFAGLQVLALRISFLPYIARR